jgi:hypothetical protein
MRMLQTGVLAIGLLLVAAWSPGGIARAQDFDAMDIEFNVLTPARSKSFWSELFDNRANRKRPFDYLSGGMPDRMIYFAGIDASKWSFGAFAGAQWMPNGVDRDGFILRLFVSESLERYVDRYGRYDTQLGRAYLLPGYMFRIGRLETQLLIGPDAQADLLFQDGRANRLRSRLGVRGIADLWWEPTPELMVQYALSATTIDSGYTTRIAAGWRLFDSFWIGPEAALSRDYYSRQTRFGVHLTGLRTNDYEWTFAAGRVSDDFGRDGVYGRFGLMLRPKRAPFFDN